MPRLLLALFLALSLATAYAQDHRHDPFTGNTDTVFVQGLFLKPFFMTANQTNGLSYVAVPAQHLINASGEVRKQFGASKGILLSEILKKADAEIGHKERGQYVVVITAADGLQVIFAYNELMYGPASGSAYLLLTDGVSGMEASGRFVVMCTSDLATAPRYVKWVRSIELRKI